MKQKEKNKKHKNLLKIVIIQRIVKQKLKNIMKVEKKTKRTTTKFLPKYFRIRKRQEKENTETIRTKMSVKR